MEHFVKPSYGKIYHFCHTKQGICVKSSNSPEYQVVLPDGEEDFDVIIDNNDCIHLVCQNKSGDIIYMNKSDDDWKRQVLMQSRGKESYPKNFSLQRAGNWLNIIYSLEYKNSRVITHQIIGSNGKPPDVLDYTNGEFSVAKDKYNNIFVLYYSLSRKNLGYMAYMWSKKEWSEFAAVPVEGLVTQPHIFIDKSDNLHITGCLNGEIIYCSNTVQTFGKGKNPVFVEKDNLYLLWESSLDQKIRAACSTDNGKSFSITTEFMAGRFSTSKVYAIAYTAYETACNASRCYGYISDGDVKFYLAPDFFNVSRVPPKPIEATVAQEAREFERKLKGTPPTDANDIKKVIALLEKISVKLDVLLNETQNFKKMLTKAENEHIIETDLRLDELEEI